jgi:hypothetical protein
MSTMKATLILLTALLLAPLAALRSSQLNRTHTSNREVFPPNVV